MLDESSTGSLLNLSGDAVVYVTASGEDIVQPSDLATVATTGAYSDLSGLPTLGTAAATDATAYATAAQGSLADSAVQPADNISTLTNDAGYITSADGGNADLLDGQHGTYYLDYTNFTNTPTIYTDAAVDTHLNTGTATTGEVLSWNGTDYDWAAYVSDATFDTYITSASLTGTTPSVDVGARDTYTLATSGNTTFTFTGAPSSGQVGTFSLIITAGGTHTLTWPASVDWAGGTAPDAPASGEKDIYTFMTVDGGTTWYGFLAGDAMA